MLITLSCLLLAANAKSKEKKTTLEDIERDYVTTKHRTKLMPPPPPPVQKPAQSPTQYGFVPVKTMDNYVQQQPRVINYYSSYIQRPPTAYTSGQGNKYTIAKFNAQPSVTYAQPSVGHAQSSVGHAQPSVTYAQPSVGYAQSSIGYAQPSVGYAQPSVGYAQPSVGYAQSSVGYAQAYAQAQQGDAQSQQADAQSQQGEAETQVGNAQPQQSNAHHGDYQNYENVQYITDNSLTAEPNYYTPQYYYVTQYQAPSTSVQTIVDPKGGIQYVMYVPTYVSPSQSSSSPSSEPHHSQVQNYETQQQSYQSETSTSNNHDGYNQQQSQPQQEEYYQQPQTETVIKREPKSLLDSYIPSYVQLQYYNRQAQKNLVQEQVVKIPRSNKSFYKQSHNYKAKS